MVTKHMHFHAGIPAGEGTTLPEGIAAEKPGDDWCSQRGLLDPATCSDVAKHCNETKQAAKVVQVGFLPCPQVVQKRSRRSVSLLKWLEGPYPARAV